jgi:hypothetical protein
MMWQPIRALHARKNFISVAFLACLNGWILTACGSSQGDRGPAAQPPQPPYDQLILDPADLNVSVASEPESNSFSVVLDPSDRDKKIVVPFRYNTGAHTHMSVALPKLQAEGCNRDPRVAEVGAGLPGTQNNDLPAFLWTTGWASGQDVLSRYGRQNDPNPVAIQGYGIEEASQPNRQETIILILFVPADCTEIDGSFTAQFRQ